jgi:uncharacterized membrane protein YdbT with pleckstrin-like domain
MHWIGIAVAILPALLVLFVIAIGPALSFLWLLLVPCLPPLLNGLITFFSTDIHVTENRLYYATGVFRRQTYELPITRFESIAMEQSLLGRFLDYGQVTIIAIGSTPITTPCIKQPAKFREALQLAVAQSD